MRCIDPVLCIPIVDDRPVMSMCASVVGYNAKVIYKRSKRDAALSNGLGHHLALFTFSCISSSTSSATSRTVELCGKLVGWVELKTVLQHIVEFHAASVISSLFCCC